MTNPVADIREAMRTITQSGSVRPNELYFFHEGVWWHLRVGHEDDETREAFRAWALAAGLFEDEDEISEAVHATVRDVDERR